jgi:hypothetical protein
MSWLRRDHSSRPESSARRVVRSERAAGAVAASIPSAPPIKSPKGALSIKLNSYAILSTPGRGAVRRWRIVSRAAAVTTWPIKTNRAARTTDIPLSLLSEQMSLPHFRGTPTVRSSAQKNPSREAGAANISDAQGEGPKRQQKGSSNFSHVRGKLRACWSLPP